MTLNLNLPDGLLTDFEHGSFSIHAVGADRELLSDFSDSSVVRWPSGDLQAVELTFLDDVPAEETRRYELRLDEPLGLEAERMIVEELAVDGRGDAIHVWNGAYDFYVGHDIDSFAEEYGGTLPGSLYVRLESENGWAKLMPLTHIFGNTLQYRDEWAFEECEPIFILSPGYPEEVAFEASLTTIDISLRYLGQAQEYCSPSPTYGDSVRSDVLDALVKIRIFRGLARVDASTIVTVHSTIYNHNGFGMGGVETELDRPRVVFGTENHVVLQGSVWADTGELTDLPEFMQIQGGRYVFRRGGTRDAWPPFTLIAEEDTFSDYYVVEGTAARAVLGYFPDFRTLAYQDTRDEGSGEIVALNMVGAGPSIPINVANPILLSQTHLGGLGGIWAEIRPGEYGYRLVALAELPFGQDHHALYDQLAARLSAPLAIDLWLGGSPNPP